MCSNRKAKLSYIYCSNQCQLDYQHQEYINKWKNNEVTGSRGISARNISKHIRRYLLEKNKQACSFCGWNKTNRVTGNSPLEVDHIDGDAENNNESNLRLLCPNCHSLTPSYRNLNKCKGRAWRKLKYIKSKP